MLNKKINRIVTRHVKPLIERGKSIKVKANAPFEEVCENTNMWIPDNSGLTVINAIPASLEAAQEPKTNPAHADLQLAIVKDMADRIAASTTYIKTTVVDAVLECRDYTNSMVTENYEETPDITIRERSMPELLYSDNLPVDLNVKSPVTSIARYTVASPITINADTTGVASEEIQLWLDTTPNVQTYWNNLFVDTSDEPRIANEVAKLTPYDRIDYGLTMVLGSTAILNNPNSVTSMGLEEITTKMRDVRRYGKSVIQKAVRYIEMSLKLNKLVISNERNCITVNGPVYQQFLDDGGTADAMLGRSIANDGVNGKKAILENVIEYTAVNRRNNAAVESSNRRMTLKYTKSALRQWVSKHTKEMVTPTPVDKQYGLRLAFEAIDGITVSDLENTYECSKNIVAKNIYYFTNANEYLGYMDQAIKHNPELTPAEASTVATIESICDYAISNLYLGDE